LPCLGSERRGDIQFVGRVACHESYPFCSAGHYYPICHHIIVIIDNCKNNLDILSKIVIILFVDVKLTIRLAEAARRLRVHPAQIGREVAAGKIASVHTADGLPLIPLSAVKAYKRIRPGRPAAT
jgi:hypothetical protein